MSRSVLPNPYNNPLITILIIACGEHSLRQSITYNASIRANCVVITCRTFLSWMIELGSSPVLKETIFFSAFNLYIHVTCLGYDNDQVLVVFTTKALSRFYQNFKFFHSFYYINFWTYV